MSEAKYSSLVASSASSAQVAIEISTDLTEITYFSVFSAGSVSSTGTGLISSTFTVSSVVLPILIAAPADIILPLYFVSLLVHRVSADPLLPLRRGFGCGSFVRISPETPLLATRIILFACLLYKPGWHYETLAGELFIVWSIPKNFAFHFHSFPFSSELYRAYFGALASTITRLWLPNYSRTNPDHPG